MMDMHATPPVLSDEKLIECARATINRRNIGRDVDVGGVAAALISGSGQIYTGVCLDAACALGFCAERAAIAALVSAGEHVITKIVAVGDSGRGVLTPCGSCRELVYQFGTDTIVLMPDGSSVKIEELLPHAWERRS